jgi:hypothetical protein
MLSLSLAAACVPALAGQPSPVTEAPPSATPAAAGEGPAALGGGAPGTPPAGAAAAPAGGPMLGGPATPPLELVASTPKGELKNPYNAEIAAIAFGGA